MILELIISRGLGICLDGHAPQTKGWSYGDNDTDTGYEFGRDGLQLGPHRVLAVELGVNPEDWCIGDEKPAQVTLTTDKVVLALPVIDWFAGTMETAVQVTLTDGSVREIDEYVLYIRAGDGPPVTRQPVPAEEDGDEESDEG